jgi:hypothetical protein
MPHFRNNSHYYYCPSNGCGPCEWSFTAQSDHDDVAFIIDSPSDEFFSTPSRRAPRLRCVRLPPYVRQLTEAALRKRQKLEHSLAPEIAKANPTKRRNSPILLPPVRGFRLPSTTQKCAIRVGDWQAQSSALYLLRGVCDCQIRNVCFCA